MTPAAFKRWIRDRQVWCSSCMVAFSGSEPVGVLIGAKRPSGTLVHTIAVNPDQVRQGHGRHLLTSLGSKLAILGPPRIVAEVPSTLFHARALFCASGYVEEAILTDYVLEHQDTSVHEAAALPNGRFLIPVTVDDLAANGLVGEADASVCWERAVESLTARKDSIAGLAIASDEQIEAYVLYVSRDGTPAEAGAPPPGFTPITEVDILALRSVVEDGAALLQHLLARLRARAGRGVRFLKVHPEEVSQEFLAACGFHPADHHVRFAAMARSN